MTANLSPALITACRDRVEAPARSLHWPSATVDHILRRGATVGSTLDLHRSLIRAMGTAREYIAATEAEGRSVPSGRVILADTLTGAKGRLARSWHAPCGGLWGCLVQVDTLLPRFRTLIPLAAGVACCETVREFGVPGAVIRWTNDVLVEGRKIGGFLVESYPSPVTGEHHVLIGFGINVNNTRFPPELRELATALAAESGDTVELAEFACRFLVKLGWNLGLLLFEEELDLAEESIEARFPGLSLLSRWRELSDSLDRRVIFGFDVESAPQYRAHAYGIGPDGGLLLRLDDGREVVEYSGEIRYL